MTQATIETTKALADFIAATDELERVENASPMNENEFDEADAAHSKATQALIAEGNQHLETTLGQWAIAELAQSCAPLTPYAMPEKSIAQLRAWLTYGTLKTEPKSVRGAIARLDARLIELECKDATENELRALHAVRDSYIAFDVQSQNRARDLVRSGEPTDDVRPDFLAYAAVEPLTFALPHAKH